MVNSVRYVNPSLSELIDRLTVDQVKEILLSPAEESFGKEIEKIEHDLDNLLSFSPFRLTSRFLRLVVALAQMNLHIWKTKEKMVNDASRFDEHLKLSHQLNGLRNQLKNALLEEAGVREGTPAKTNVGTDNLQGWQLSVLIDRDGSNLPGRSAKPEERHYRLVLTELIDALTINQIKEVFSTRETTVKGVEETENLALDLDLNLKARDVRRKGRLIGLIALLAQANLHVWLNKDSMGSGGAHYHRLLDFAQDMNGLRNHVRNILMEEFGESEACNQRAVFLSRDPGKWYSPILRRLNGNGKESGTSLPALRKNDLCGCLGIEEAELSEDCREILRDRDFGYRKLEGPERDGVIRDIVRRIVSGDFWVSGGDKRPIWEQGWSENLEEYERTKDLFALRPKFLQAKKVLRLGGEYIEPKSPHFEFDLVDVFRRWVFRKHLSGVKAVYEFGCGSCQHLPVLAELFPDKEIHGLDWAEASLKITNQLAQDKGWKIQGHRFDLFSPDPDLPLTGDCGVFTVGTLEQLGNKFEPFLQFLMKKRPAVVFHIESLTELYDESRLVDYLAKVYDRKRNYLDGYIHRLRELERERKVDLVRVQRVYFGSMFHDSYSLAVWRPGG